METILIWLGSGFAFAAGFMIGMIVMTLACRNANKTEQLNARVNDLLEERNLIGIREAAALERIASSIENRSQPTKENPNG